MNGHAFPQPDGENLTAAVPLGTDQLTPAPVWDEYFGWRIATSRRHAIGRSTVGVPEGEGIG
ncbi:hypothetical protein ACFVT6_19555 [Streptomyces sp. NPDC058049]|uniref:hypothetical protein n=1 Tax=Streptomyces sp. NPDC058049 TaxID=3346314 RepID=UPI0036E64901